MGRVSCRWEQQPLTAPGDGFGKVLTQHGQQVRRYRNITHTRI
jgi:hypothetical protein